MQRESRYDKVDLFCWSHEKLPAQLLGEKRLLPFLRLSQELLVLPDSFARLPGGHWRFWGKTTRSFFGGFPIASRMYSFTVYNHV